MAPRRPSLLGLDGATLEESPAAAIELYQMVVDEVAPFMSANELEVARGTVGSYSIP